MDTPKNEKPPKRTGVLSGISDIKMKIIDTLISDMELCKLLRYGSTDVLSRPDLTEDERYALVDNAVYGYRYIPDVVKEQKSFVSMELANFVPQEGFRQFSDDYVMGYVIFYILVDQSIMKTDSGYRQDLIQGRVYDLFQENIGFGIGELRMEVLQPLWAHDNKFGGYTVSFGITDFK